MTAYFARQMKSFLAKLGFSLQRTTQKDFFKSYYESIQEKYFKTQNEDIITVIFSKDRAMQLEALLRSYFENVKNPAKIKILYTTSSADHFTSYEELKTLYKDRDIQFIEEESFRSQIITLLEKAPENRVLFFVDDMLFTRKIDFNTLRRINPFKNIVTLSRGKDLTYSTVLAKKIDVPHLKKIDDGMFSFSWKEISYFSDWTFPLGVSGYMFSTKEFAMMLGNISFKAPNSMEGQLQLFNSHFVDRYGICAEYVVTPCIHANLTQTEGYNNVTGHFSLDELLKEWNNGKRIKYEDFNNISVIDAEKKKYTFTER